MTDETPEGTWHGPAKQRGYYLTAERRHHRWPTCPRCGRQHDGEWVNASDAGALEKKWTPGTHGCPNQECRLVD